MITHFPLVNWIKALAVVALLVSSAPLSPASAGQGVYVVVEDVVVSEGNSEDEALNASFIVRLTKPLSSNLSLTYTTSDWTAVSGVDYVTASGNIVNLMCKFI